MIHASLTVLAISTLVTSIPIEKSRIHLKNDIVLVPFDVQYVPLVYNPMSNNRRDSTLFSTSYNQKHQTEETAELSQSGDSESREISSVSKKHRIAKRQAPGNSFLGIRTRAGNRRIRFQRLPAFVGYLTDNDDFPTVA